MRNFLKQGEAVQHTSSEKKEQLSQVKLHVAFVNRTLINSARNSNVGSRAKESVFSTTNGSYYINGIPAILSQDEEAMIADYYECSEYY